MIHLPANQIDSLRSSSSRSLLLPMVLLALLAFPSVDAMACVTNAECADDGSICTDEVCNPASPGADAFGCTHPNPGDPAPICPTAYSGLATVVFMDVGNVIDLVLVEAGPLPVAGGAGESYLVDANISQPGIELATQALHALTIGQGNEVNTSATVQDLDTVVAGVAITADVVSSQSQTVCENGVASIDGSSAFTNLVIAGQSITASGEPNQEVVLSAGVLVVTVILNEQTGSAVGGTGDITVAALHIVIDSTLTGRLAEVIVSSSHSDIVCGIAEFCTTNADCTDDGNICTTEVCDVDDADADAFGCSHQNNTVPCDDGLFCNGVDTCLGGGCTHPGDPCAGGGICGDTCNEIDDTCFNVAGTTCRTASGECDVAETCTGTSADCPADGFEPIGTACASDDNLCTADTCDGSGTCDHTDNSSLCDDGLFCNGVETCSPAPGCEAGAPPNCADAVACTSDSCNEATDSCERIPNHSLCDDSNVCTDDTCAPVTGCESANNTAPCDDQNACTTNDQCVDGQCAPGTSAVCGDGVVDPACGEQCDTPGGEICNNGIDDDGDLLVDCADPDCADVGIQSCDDQCQLSPPCVAILDDPAIIYTDDTGERMRNGLYVLSFHGRLIPTTPMDPMVDGFAVSLGNANGELYRAEVSPEDLQQRGNRYSLKRASADAAKRDGGVGSLRIRARKDGGLNGFGIRVKAYGDVSRATLARMTTQVYFGDDVAYLTATWTRRPKGWLLRRNQY